MAEYIARLRDSTIYKSERIEEFMGLMNISEKSAALYGAGAYGRMLLGLCEKSGIEVTCVCDSDASKVGGMLDGVRNCIVG